MVVTLIGRVDLVPDVPASTVKRPVTKSLAVAAAAGPVSENVGVVATATPVAVPADIVNLARFGVPVAWTPETKLAPEAAAVANAEPAGAEITRTDTVTVSEAANVPFRVTVFEVAIPTRAAEEAPGVIEVTAPRYAADAGATEVKTPKPREATATSAMRLKVVFVDICFLSISRSREFPPVGFG